MSLTKAPSLLPALAAPSPAALVGPPDQLPGPTPTPLPPSCFSEKDWPPDCGPFPGAAAYPAPGKAEASRSPVRCESKAAGAEGPEAANRMVRPGIARFKTSTPSRIPIPGSPFLTIPPGLSPAAFLESPVLLSAGQAEPTPTTGTFPLTPLVNENASRSAPVSDTLKERSLDQDGRSFFVSRPFPIIGKNSLSSTLLTGLGSFGASHQQALGHVHTQTPSSVPRITVLTTSSLSQSTVDAIPISPNPTAVVASSAANLVIPLEGRGPTEPFSQLFSECLEKASVPHPTVASVPQLPLSERSSSVSVSPLSLSDRPSVVPSLSLQDRPSVVPPLSHAFLLPDKPSNVPVCPLSLPDRSSKDGYNWRKYGQKQVKGSEYTRSYYKCTHPNCAMKKKVERSHDGQVIEIVYKGEHNHAKIQVAHRMHSSGSHISGVGSRQSVKRELKAEKDEVSAVFAKTDGAAPSDLKGRRMLDPLSKANVSTGGIGTSGLCSTSSSHDEDDDEICKFEDGDDDEPDSKHRKLEETIGKVLVSPSRTIHEPRVVIQTTSDVDTVDDGYRWRKYGQKVVKGNPHPRSYYKCTNLGCYVRKHVERSSTDVNAVILTYEGKHNHDAPAAKNNNYDSSGSAVIPSLAPLLPSSMRLNGSVIRPAPSVQDHNVLGKGLEDRMKAHDRSFNFGTVLVSQQQNRCHEALEESLKISGNTMGSVMHEIMPFDDSESSSQVTILRPKEEQVVSIITDGCLQTGFSSSTSFCQGEQYRPIT